MAGSRVLVSGIACSPSGKPQQDVAFSTKISPLFRWQEEASHAGPRLQNAPMVASRERHGSRTECRPPTEERRTWEEHHG